MRNDEVGRMSDGHSTILSLVMLVCAGILWEGRALGVGFDSNDVQVSVGSNSVCAATNHRAYCWGALKTVPDDLAEVDSVSTGDFHACALSKAGPRCWGENEGGPLDIPSDLGDVRSVHAGQDTTCALTDRGIRCWGFWVSEEKEIPSFVPGSYQIFSLDSYSACGVRLSGELDCWRGDEFEHPFLTQRPHVMGITSVDVAWNNGCVVAGGKPICWSEKILPEAGIEAAKQIVFTGFTSACAILPDDQVSCWSNGAFDPALQVPSDLGKVLKISAKNGVACAVTLAGRVRCWGREGDERLKVPPGI